MPNSPLQSEKSKRYDRQLRLWGDHGQSSLEQASVCLVGGGVLGTEVLKSLVLPGLGNFTILDPGVVTEQDLGNNFFLLDGEGESLGQSRAEVATRLLTEMNSDVRGEARQEAVEQVLAEQPHFFKSFTLVLAANVSDRALSQLSGACWPLTPLVVCRSLGMLGYLRVCQGEHTVQEAHPDSAPPDLRLDRPWPALAAWLEAQHANLGGLSLAQHAHTPYPVLIHGELAAWRREHAGQMPANYREKKTFAQRLLEKRRRRENNPEVPEEEENFEEAARAVNTVVMETKIPESVSAILADPSAQHITAESDTFWLLVAALNDFVAREGRLPVSGVLPDMFSDSTRYIQLQGLYRDQALADSEAIGRKVAQLGEAVGRTLHLGEQEVRRFCREARFLRIQRGSQICSEFNGAESSEWLSSCDQENDRMYYLILRATDKYHTQFGADPGLREGDIEVDIARLKTIVTSMLGSVPQGVDEHIHEVVRYGGAVLHSVAAFLGGCVAQECIKIITGQFVPIDNVILYNAVTSNVTPIKI